MTAAEPRTASPSSHRTGASRAGKRTRSKVKHYILDTNVLIHDPQSIFQFEDNVVWIPVTVLEELDSFKGESTTRGAHAREIHRKLSSIFKSSKDMQRGVKLPNGGKIQVAINGAVQHKDGQWLITSESKHFNALRTLFPNLSSADNRILATAAYLADSEKSMPILVTKDLNLMLKARSLGLEAQDYRTDRVEDSDISRSQRSPDMDEVDTLEVNPHMLQAFASQGYLDVDKNLDFHPNQYFMLRTPEDPTHGIPARHMADRDFIKLRSDYISIRGGRTVKPANLGQHFFLDALFDPEISLITVYGKAGTGKTLLSVGAALSQVQAGLYEKMLITRVIMPTGRDIGFLPGRMEEKMQPWVQPAYDALEFLMTKPRTPEQFEGKKQSRRKGTKTTADAAAVGNGQQKPNRPYEGLLQNGTLEIEALCHIRGRSIPNSIFIVDEAQQLTPHEAKTLVTRMGQGSKLILIGDLAQIDNPYVDAHTNGLVFTRNRLRGQAFSTHVNLFKGERSVMAEVAANVM